MIPANKSLYFRKLGQRHMAELEPVMGYEEIARELGCTYKQAQYEATLALGKLVYLLGKRPRLKQLI